MDVIIPVSKGHVIQLQKALEFIKKNLPHDDIIIITNKDNFEFFVANEDVRCVDENTILDFGYSDIEHSIISRQGNAKRAGWYFQQFLKMGYARICRKAYYLVWDADTIPLKPIVFFDGDKMLFNMKEEHHAPYFDTIYKLLGNNMKLADQSFITEGMVIKTTIMKEVIDSIESSPVSGRWFYEKIINAIDENELNYSGFSEYETYGTYLINNYPQLYEKRQLKTERHGMKKYGKLLDKQELNALDYDTISFETWDKPLMTRIYSKLVNLLKM